MNFLKRLFYRAERDLRQAFKDHAEKVYYKAYPERIGEHDIAIAPIKPLRITTYDLHCINLVAEVRLPRELTEGLSDAQEEEFDKYLKHELFSKFEPELVKYMKIKRDNPPDPYFVNYRARIKFYVDLREEA